MIYEFKRGQPGPATAARVAELIAAQRPLRPLPLVERLRCWMGRVATGLARRLQRRRPSALPAGPRLQAGGVRRRAPRAAR